MAPRPLEYCCQCDAPTGCAGRADGSLYTDNDWGPYCEDCWGDADYWRCLTDEKVTKIERLRDALRRIRDGGMKVCAEWEIARAALSDNGRSEGSP